MSDLFSIRWNFSHLVLWLLIVLWLSVSRVQRDGLDWVAQTSKLRVSLELGRTSVVVRQILITQQTYTPFVKSNLLKNRNIHDTLSLHLETRKIKSFLKYLLYLSPRRTQKNKEWGIVYIYKCAYVRYATPPFLCTFLTINVPQNK